jgi:hypothetical protein
MHNSAGNVSTFGVMFQNELAGSLRAYWYSPAAKSNGSYASEQRSWFVASGREFWLR